MSVVAAMRESIQVMRRAGVRSISQAVAVLAIRERGPMSCKELAEEIGVTSAAITNLCDRLEEVGLLGPVPRPHGTDRRIRRLKLTKLGAAVCEAIIAGMEEREVKAGMEAPA